MRQINFLSIVLLAFLAFSFTAFGQATAPASSQAAAPDSASQKQTAKIFNDVFGEELSKAKTPDQKLSLAKKMLEAAQRGANDPGLVKLLCLSSYELATKSEQGYEVAQKSVEYLGDNQPGELALVQQKVMDLHQLVYSRARGDNRKVEGDKFIELLIESAETARGEENMTQAMALLDKAATFANAIKSDSAVRIRQLQTDYKRVQNLLKKADSLQQKLKMNSADTVTRSQLVQLYVVEFDAPKQALALVSDKRDTPEVRLLSLASNSTATLTEKESLDLAEYYCQLSASASGTGKVVVLSRAKGYYERFLEAHEEKDAEQARVRLLCDKVNDDLAKLRSSLPQDGDLLRLVRLNRDVLQGRWTVSGDLVMQEDMNGSRVALPVTLQGSYELEFTFTTPNDNVIILNLPVGNTALTVVETADKIGMCVDDKDWATNDTSKRHTHLDLNARHVMLAKVTVADNSCTVAIEMDKKALTNWTGKQGQINRHGWWGFPLGMPGIGADRVIRVHSVKIRKGKTTRAYEQKSLAPFAGKWEVKYSNGVLRKYTVTSNGILSKEENGQLRVGGRLYCIGNEIFADFVDWQFERWTLVDDRVKINHYNPFTLYPSQKPNCTAVGSRSSSK